jgi:cysteine-rich repeat protein
MPITFRVGGHNYDSTDDCKYWNLTIHVTHCHPCGNSLPDAGEACDDGNNTSGDGCSATCTIESGYQCDRIPDPDVCTICGDGKRIGTE